MSVDTSGLQMVELGVPGRTQVKQKKKKGQRTQMHTPFTSHLQQVSIPHTQAGSKTFSFALYYLVAC